METATQQGMLRAGIAPGSSPLAHRETLQRKVAHVEIFKRGRGSDGVLRDQYLHASAQGVVRPSLSPSREPAASETASLTRSSPSLKQHDDVKDLFRTLEGRIAQVERKHDHKTGGLTYSSQRTSSTSTPSLPHALVPSIVRSPASSPAERAFGTSRVPAFDNGSDGEGADEPCAFPHAQGLEPPRTADELAAVLAELKPGKKILKVAVNIDIEETFVTEVVVERSQPARSASPLPSLSSLLSSSFSSPPPSTDPSSRPSRRARPRRPVPQWPALDAPHLGQSAPRRHVAHRLAHAREAGPHVRRRPPPLPLSRPESPVLTGRRCARSLRCTKKVHVEIHFQLQLEVGQ